MDKLLPPKNSRLNIRYKNKNIMDLPDWDYVNENDGNKKKKAPSIFDQSLTNS